MRNEKLYNNLQFSQSVNESLEKIIINFEKFTFRIGIDFLRKINRFSRKRKVELLFADYYKIDEEEMHNLSPEVILR